MGLMHRANNFVTRKLPLKQARSRLERSLASLTFDDFPKSAWTVAGPIMQRFGARATYYAAGRFCGVSEDGIDYFDAEDLRAAHRAGHEIGAHSYAHRMAPSVGSTELAADADRNAEALGEILGGVRLSSYAYPYGEASPRSKALMGRRFASARGIRPGVNAGRIDLAQLLAVPIEHRRWRPDEIQAAAREARARNGWLILFTHDVGDQPSPFGCTPQMLTEVLEILAAETIPVVPVKHAMAEAVFGTRAD
ncbi:polysaccharide deacetylase family protein [Caulobacter sp. S45]|uniref:polysaccharide deacetylase family protein n=1 Tax=Caulobacter sp. S45 TaxID=1641861 RepID=UPI00131A6A4D|nr:polysaccharide deacetylase family protein [Caulobacter sp. S45]